MEEPPALHPVKLYVYDLSKGMARRLSPLMLGKHRMGPASGLRGAGPGRAAGPGSVERLRLRPGPCLGKGRPVAGRGRLGGRLKREAERRAELSAAPRRCWPLSGRGCAVRHPCGALAGSV